MITDVTVGGVQETSAEGSASKFTCYEVRTRLANGAEFVAWRRFSEFDRLHASLALNVPFACTKSFWGRFDDAVIAKRKAELECYVQTVLLACGGRALPALGSFLQLPVELHAQNDEVPASVFAGGSGELPPVAGEGGHPVAHVGRQGWMPQFGGREGQTPYGSPARGLPEFGGAGAQLGGAGSGAMSGGAFPPRVGSVRSDGASGPVGGMNSLLSLPTSAEEYEQRHEAIHNLATPAAPARQPELETKLDKLDNLVVVSMILPVRISRVDAGKDLDPEDDQGRAEGDYEWEIEFLAESLIGRQQLSHVIDDVGSVHWVGCPAWSSISAAESASLSDALEAVGCTALILPLEQRAPHFAFCRKVLWPLLHNQSLHSAGRLDEPFSDEEWRAYCNVNKKMTDKVLEIAEPDSMVWVHDYHLLLLPSFLIRKLPVANVGLSLHTPFPSSDVFRALSVRDELLRAMLNADLVHFHLFEYARNFLACCKRMLGLEYEFKPGGFLGVECSGRHTMVSVCCAGINPAVLLPAVQTLTAPDSKADLLHIWPGLASRLASMEAALPPAPPPRPSAADKLGSSAEKGRERGEERPLRRVQLIVGVDEVDRLKGIPLKLHAYRQLLREHPPLRGKVVLAQVGLMQAYTPVGGHSLSTQAALDELRALTKEGRSRAGSANSALASPPISPAAKGGKGNHLMPPAGSKKSKRSSQSGSEVAGSAVLHLPDSVHLEIRLLVEAINSEFPDSVWYTEALTLSPEQRAPLWAEADVALFTCVREGVNLLPLEAAFVAGTARRQRIESQGRANSQPPSTIVLSEFSPAALTLNGSFRINPWSKEKSAQMIGRALKTDVSERDARAAKDLAYSADRTASAWSQQVCTDLKKGRRHDSAQWTAVGFGLNVRMVGMGLHFQPLNTAAVTKAYRASEHRLIFLDWGGTLIPIDLPFYDQRTDDIASASAAAKSAAGLIPPATLQTLRELAEDKNNFLMVLSGLTRDKVDQAFGSARSVACAAEHGFWYRLKAGQGAQAGGSDGWQTNYADRQMTWYEVAAAILDVYTARTAGTYVTKKGSSLTWKFDDADPEFGAMQAKELHHQMEQVLGSWNDVHINTGKGYLEVGPRDINKGSMVDFICQRQTELRGCPPDFILCIGDDSADEFMFSKLQARYPHAAETGLQLFTCTVGRKPSTAQFYLPDHERVVELLMSMRLQSAGRAKYFSVAGDLKNLSSMGEQVGGGGGSIGGRASNSSLAGMGSLGEGRSSMHDNSTKGVGGRLGSN